MSEEKDAAETMLHVTLLQHAVQFWPQAVLSFPLAGMIMGGASGWLVSWPCWLFGITFIDPLYQWGMPKEWTLTTLSAALGFTAGWIKFCGVQLQDFERFSVRYPLWTAYRNFGDYILDEPSHKV